MKSPNQIFSIGSWITLGHTSVTEIMAEAGFDWLCVDLEHTVIDYQTMQDLITVIQGKNCKAYVRVGENNPLIIKRVLDAGADGIIVPMVNSKQDAQDAVDAVRYPPLGKRGVGLGRAQGYGNSFEKYLKKQKSLDIIIQVEHIRAIENIDTILTVSGISGTIIGPYDLSASMGKTGKFEDREVLKALSDYEKYSFKHKVPMGYHIVDPDIDKFLKMKDKGYKMLALSFDARFLDTSVRKNLIKLRDLKN